MGLDGWMGTLSAARQTILHTDRRTRHRVTHTDADRCPSPFSTHARTPPAAAAARRPAVWPRRRRWSRSSRRACPPCWWCCRSRREFAAQSFACFALLCFACRACVLACVTAGRAAGSCFINSTSFFSKQRQHIPHGPTLHPPRALLPSPLLTSHGCNSPPRNNLST